MQEGGAPDAIYNQLRDWYLARLRAQMQLLSESAAQLTPMAKIEADRSHLEQLIIARARGGPIVAVELERARAAWLLVAWLAANLAVFFWGLVQTGIELPLATAAYLHCTLLRLFFVTDANMCVFLPLTVRAVAACVFFCLPLFLLVACPPVRITVHDA